MRRWTRISAKMPRLRAAPTSNGCVFPVRVNRCQRLSAAMPLTSPTRPARPTSTPAAGMRRRWTVPSNAPRMTGSRPSNTRRACCPASVSCGPAVYGACAPASMQAPTIPPSSRNLTETAGCPATALSMTTATPCSCPCPGGTSAATGGSTAA